VLRTPGRDRLASRRSSCGSPPAHSRRRADNAIRQALSFSSCSLVPVCGFLSCQDNNVCIRLQRIRAKTQLSRLVNGRRQRAVQLWVTTAAGLLLPRPIPGRPAAGQLTDRNVRRCASPANIPRAFTARSVQAPDGRTGCLSHRRGRHRPSAHARIPAGAGPRRSSLTLAKNNRGPVEHP
jgi:hypothetical protein